MTAKEKFYNMVESLKAERREEIKNAEVYAAYASGDDVHILHVYNKDTFDHYVIDALVARVEPHVLKSIIFATDTDSEWYADDDMRSSLRSFAGVNELSIDTKEELVNVIVWLWNNTGAFDNMWETSGPFFHEEFEDDKQVNPAELLALDIEQRGVVNHIEDLFVIAGLKGVGYYLDENNNIVFYNANNVERADGDEEADIYDTSHAYSTDIQPCWWAERDGFNIKNNKQ